MQTGNTLVVLSSADSAASDHALCKFAQFLGLQTELVTLRGDLAEPPAALLASPPGGRVLALGCTTLQQLYRRDWFVSSLAEARFVFMYGFAPAEGGSPELQWFTGGALSAVTSINSGAQRFTIHSDVKHGGFPVSGRSYSVELGSTTVFSGATPGGETDIYITANGHPHFVSIKRGQTLLFLLAGTELVDIDTALTRNSSLRPWYAQLIAMSIFLRTAFGSWCWNSPVTGATFIVDDPYLRKRYGFISYEPLVRELERAHGALTIAFIPYNHRRSNPQTIGLLRQHADRFSICVHGCDHTGGEFASLDEGWLAGTAASALDRMEAHTRLTEMPFDNVMVFPQSRFSTKAIGALKTCGFEAAVNSTPWPVDSGDNPLTIRDFLQVAVTRDDSFPIFVRRYPRDLFDYAFDAFFQKPVLAVEHHGFFRQGYGPLTDFFRNASNLDSKLVWMPLGRTIRSSCILKKTGEGQFAVEHYSPTLRLKNPTQSDVLLSLEKPESSARVEAVVIGGKRIPFEVNSGRLHYAARLGAGEELNVTILYRQVPRTTRKPSWKYKFTASARRILSDARDNYLARSERLLSLVEKIKNKRLS